MCVYFAARALLTGLAGGGFAISSLVQWGVWALALELTGLIINFAALMCSHTAAFHTDKNLKMAALRHLSRMPIGYFEENPSGKLRKIIDENSAQMETYLAHQLPDLVSAQVTTVASLVLMLAMDWRIGLPLIVLMLASFACQMTMMGEKTMNFMKRYQDAQEEMNHEAVEYVRGISVIKVFGQSVHSIRRFKEAINAYRDDALAFTMACKPGYVGFNTVVNAAFLVLIPAALIGMTSAGDLTAFIENFLFYLIFAPACASVLNKIMMSVLQQKPEPLRHWWDIPAPARPPSGPWFPAFMMCRRGALRWAAWNFLRSPGRKSWERLLLYSRIPNY